MLCLLLTVGALWVGSGLLVPGAAAAQEPSVTVSEQRIDVPGGQDGPVSLDTTLYLPASTPAPAVLVAHGFGGSKASVDEEARELASRGFVVLTWSARGFGASTGRIHLNDPDHEVADARRLLDWLAGRPEVVLDAPGDPRVGVTGASYGGALALLLAGHDPRVDALAPMITWNDLGQALFPNAAGPVGATSPAAAPFAPNGVFKQGWAGVFFSSGLASPTPGGPLTCGRFTPEVCAGYTEAATTGRPSPAIVELLRRSSPATVTDRITAPTLLVQGEQDTLFGLDHADANARQIAADGTPVRVVWYGGGHDGAQPGPEIRDEIAAWFEHHLTGRGADPGTGFTYEVESGVRTNNEETPTSRRVTAPFYPGLSGAPATETRSVPLTGDAQVAVHPAGGNPAAITSLPGVGAALGRLGGRVAAITSDIPGQSAQFSSEPLESAVTITGAARVTLAVSRLPGQPAPAEAVLFAKLYEIGADGRRTLLGNAVAPLRVPVPTDGSPTVVTVTLPAVVAPIEAGNRLVVAVGTTDQGYAGLPDPAVWRIGLAEPTLAVPVVAGQASAAGLPVVPLVGIAGVLGAALVAALVAWVRGRRRAHRSVTDDDAVPLRIEGIAKTYRGGFRAVQDVSFTVEKGMVLGLLGPNGAGKTTVLRMLLGLIRPTAGTIRAFGEEVVPGAPVLARIGAFVEGPGFLPHLSGEQNLRLYWAATGRPESEAHFEEALEIAGLGASIHRRVGTYSQGMRQRLAIAQAMLGLPELLVLDEPTNGLDPPQIHAMREMLRRYAAGGRTVVVSSHLLAEVEQTCTHVVVMHRGRVVAAGTVEEIISGGSAASFTVDEPNRAAEVLGGLAGVRGVTVDGAHVHAELNGTPRAEAVRALVSAGVEVRSAGPRRRLEDAFLQLVGEDTGRESGS